ncbi:unnamed protein product [Rhizopus stolonifer]
MQTTTVYYTSIYPSYPNVESQNNSSVTTEQANSPFVVKRKQVKNACTNCQRACKKCDDARPCPRCVKYNVASSCVSSVRKERMKGIKRGPYKRRQKLDNCAQEQGEQQIIKQEGKEDDEKILCTIEQKDVVQNEGYSYPNLNQYGAYYEYVLPIYSPYPGVPTSDQNNEKEDEKSTPTEEDSKFARLTQLCSAALKENTDASPTE